MLRFQGVDAITFNTLVHHRSGNGRGADVLEYLHRHGLECDPWEHQILYDVFEAHGREYSTRFTAAQKEQYLIHLTQRLFQRLHVSCGAEAASAHAIELWKLIGPSSLEIFDDVTPTLQHLRNAGYRLAVISNWQCGLGHFCEELDLTRFFDAVLASAEIGCEKPSPEIFQQACRRLGVQSARVLHVGDTPADDIAGAGAAGIRAVLVCRDGVPPAGIGVLRGLDELPALLGLGPEIRSTVLPVPQL